MLDFFPLYKLACFYCFEDSIPVLREKLPDAIKEQIYDEGDIFQAAQSHLDAFWTNILRDLNYISGFIDSERNFYQHAFEVAAFTRNKAATEYFYNKLPNEEREASLLDTAKYVANYYSNSVNSNNNLRHDQYSEVLRYLLSQITHEKQIELFESLAYNVLCFLAWLRQDLFLEICQLAWEFLSEDEFYRLLQNLGTNRTISECSRLKLVEECFKRSSANLKSYFIEKECLDGNFLYKLFQAEQTEIIRCVFLNIEAAAKVRLVFCDEGFRICRYLIERRKLNLLKLFIGEAMLSAEDRERLLENLKPFVVLMIEKHPGCEILE